MAVVVKVAGVIIITKQKISYKKIRKKTPLGCLPLMAVVVVSVAVVVEVVVAVVAVDSVVVVVVQVELLVTSGEKFNHRSRGLLRVVC